MGKRGFAVRQPVRDALRLIADGLPVFASAKACGVAPSGLFVHLSRFSGTPAERAGLMLEQLEAGDECSSTSNR